MLIHDWDSAKSEAEWRQWLASRECFGVLAVDHPVTGEAPMMVPTHFTLSGNQILLHLHKQNSAIDALRRSGTAALTIFGDYAYVPGYWRNPVDVEPERGVPTSYYAALNFRCAARLVDDAEGIARVLTAQMGHMQPEGVHVAVTPESQPYGPMLSAVVGVILEIQEVEAKFKYDDHKSEAHRNRVSENLIERGGPLDAAAAEQQRRRLRESQGA